MSHGLFKIEGIVAYGGPSSNLTDTYFCGELDKGMEVSTRPVRVLVLMLMSLLRGMPGVLRIQR